MKKVIFGVTEHRQTFLAICDCESPICGSEKHAPQFATNSAGAIELDDFILLANDIIFCPKCGRRYELNYDFVAGIAGYSIAEIERATKCYACGKNLPCLAHMPNSVS